LKGGDTWELVLKGAGAEDVKNRLTLPGKDLSSVSAETMEDGTVRLSFFVPASGSEAPEGTGSPAGEKIFDWAVGGGLKILGMSRKKLSLEDIFVKLTGEEAKP
jgi:ABC-2 type transport system ATP-binding protein